MGAMLSNAPFARTKPSIMQQQEANASTGFKAIGTMAQPSYEAMVSFKNREQVLKSEGENKLKTNQTLYSGMSNFGTTKIFQNEKANQRKEVAQMTNTLAKMRFNIGVEQAKRIELEKTIEEQQLLEAKKRRQDAEDNLRRTNLTQAQKHNLKMNSQIQEYKKAERKDVVKEKDEIQTSLVAKKVQDAQEVFKFNVRKQKIVEANKNNFDQKIALTQNNWAQKVQQVQEESVWLQNLSDIQYTEDDFLKKQKQMQIMDLRETYKEQEMMKQNRDQTFLKF